jgi:hypothetical protein
MSILLMVVGGFFVLGGGTVVKLVYDGWREEPPEDFWES